ncbi:MAG TPA: hypothetical protein VFQ84_13200 [Arenimonas sp.]|uniref:hypothetical protein n=1 Tax=Arenimonas sp. TaxID=1872635 RepID=UPI002D8088AE|nr:hypothetical protein [Arenimonas sp.]HEU0154288.1 hypothetical protein [Arenimonas sp.]
MEKHSNPARRRAPWLGALLVLAALAWLGRDALVQVAAAASSEAARLAAECTKR